MLKFYLTLALCFSISSSFDIPAPDENGIRTMNSSMITKATEQFESLFVLIYVKGEQNTGNIRKIFEKIGKEFKQKQSMVNLVKIPVNYGDGIYTKYDVEGPTVFMALLDHGERFVEYTGNITNAEGLIRFIERKLQPPLEEINDLKQLKQIIENADCVSVGFFQNLTMSEYDDYRVACDWFYECFHFATSDSTLIKHFSLEEAVPTVKFFKGCIHDDFDFPKQLVMDTLNVLKYFMVCKEPDVAKFGMDWLMKRKLKDPKFTLVLFVSKSDIKLNYYVDTLRKYARRYREEINMVYVEVDGDEDISSMLYTFNVKSTDAPIMRAIELTNRYANNTRKYKPRRKTINYVTVGQFIGDVYYRQLEPYLISEDLPSDWNQEPIVKVVGSNFRNITEDPLKTVLIIFYYNEPRYSSFAEGELKRLASDYQKAGRTDIIIGKSNYIDNEYYGWHPHKFPAMILFHKGVKKQGIICQMEFSYDNMKKFIDSDGLVNEDEEQPTKSSESKNTSIDGDNDDEGEVKETGTNTDFVKTEL